MENRRGPIGIELVRRGIVTEQDINKAVEYQSENPDKKIIEILDILGLCDEITLTKALGEILDEKSMVLTTRDIKINVLSYISIDVARRAKAIPFAINGNKIKVCFSDKFTKANIDTVRLILLNKGLIMERYITLEKNIL